MQPAGRRRGEREVGNRTENKAQSGKSNYGRLANAGSRSDGYETPSQDRLVYMITCLIGHCVEVQVKNGSVYSGIFHATNAEKDFGIILKMAHMVKDDSLQGQKSAAGSICKVPWRTLIIPAKELVQIIGKDVPVTRDGLLNEVQSEKQQELMLDSFISQSHHIEVERELEPWVHDGVDLQCTELENIFDGPWNRGWDQFQINETLFGVKSTFNEELYTTKLEKGPQMIELEKEASRIAREIEGEDTHDLHLAEERGIHLSKHFDIDEETRFSSVYRVKVADDSGHEEEEDILLDSHNDDHEEEEDILLDSHNDETFGNSSASVMKSATDFEIGKSNDVYRVMSRSCPTGQAGSSQPNIGLDLIRSESHENANQLVFESFLRASTTTASDSRIQENLSGEHGLINNANDPVEKQTLVEEARLLKPDRPMSASNEQEASSEYVELSSSAPSVKSCEKMNSSDDLVEKSGNEKLRGQTHSANRHSRPSNYAPSRSDFAVAASTSSGPDLSPSSSVGSMSSEKSTLNPHAKEFKLNPNAKSFIPSPMPVRSPSPVSDNSYYFPPDMSAVTQMPIGIGTSYPHQRIMYPQVGPVPAQAYYHPNGPQYGQQMLLGHPRQVVYMPGYQPEMPYKGRDY